MPDNVVKVVFEADTSQLKGAFSEVNSQLAGVASQGAAGMVQETEHAFTTIASRAKTSGPLMFDPAYAAWKKASREASSQAKKDLEDAGTAAKSTERTVRGVISAYTAYRVARGVFEAAKYVYDESKEREAAEVRYKNLAGNTPEAAKQFEELKTSSKEVSLNIDEMADAQTTFLESRVPLKGMSAEMQGLAKQYMIAQVPADKIGESVENMAKNALVAHVPLQEMADLYLKIATRGELSGRQIAMVMRMTGDETGKLAQKFQEMTILIPLMQIQMERLHVVEERRWQDSETAFSRRLEYENRSYSYEQKISDIATSATGADTAAFRALGGQPPSVHEENIKEDMKAYHMSQADAEFYAAGRYSGSSLIDKAKKQQQIGMKALAGEGVDVQGAMSAGVLTAGPLMAAGRATTEYGRESGQIKEKQDREDTHLKDQREYEDKKQLLEIKKENLRTEITQAAATGITTLSDKGKVAWTLEEQTIEARERQKKADAERAAQSQVGNIQNIETGLQNIGSQDPGKLSTWVGIAKDLRGGIGDMEGSVFNGVLSGIAGIGNSLVPGKPAKIYTPEEVQAGRGANAVHSMSDAEPPAPILNQILTILQSAFGGN
jgi:hypothetical protein